MVNKNSLRIKIKNSNYLKVAKPIKGYTSLNLWKNMKEGKVNKNILINTPEELKAKAKELIFKLEKKYK